MSDLITWRARRAALSALLDEPDAVERRDLLKAEIIALFKAVEQNIVELTALKDDIKLLVDKWKALAGAELRPAVRRGAAGGARRSHRCVDVHREGLEPAVAR